MWKKISKCSEGWALPVVCGIELDSVHWKTNIHSSSRKLAWIRLTHYFWLYLLFFSLRARCWLPHFHVHLDYHVLFRLFSSPKESLLRSVPHSSTRYPLAKYRRRLETSSAQYVLPAFSCASYTCRRRDYSRTVEAILCLHRVKPNRK